MRAPVLCCVAASLLAASAVAEPRAPDSHRRDYRVRAQDGAEKDESRRLYTVTGFATWVEPKGAEWVFHREEWTAQGARYDWEVTVDPQTLVPRRVHKSVRDKSGTVVQEITESYAAVAARFPAFAHAQTLPLVAQYVDTTPGRTAVHRLAANPEFEPWVLTLVPEGDETVTVPAGTIPCTKVKVKYDLANLPSSLRIMPSFVLRQFMGDIHLWVAKAPPHALVKFEGRLDGNAPKVHELVKVTPLAPAR